MVELPEGCGGSLFTSEYYYRVKGNTPMIEEYRTAEVWEDGDSTAICAVYSKRSVFTIRARYCESCARKYGFIW